MHSTRAAKLSALLAILALYIVLVASIDCESLAGRKFFKNLLSCATYTSNWFVTLDARVISCFTLSLAAEEQFYLPWPSMERFVGPTRAIGVMALVIAVVAHLGSMIYGMYLLHMLVKNSLRKGLSYGGLGDSPYLLFLLPVSATVVVATQRSVFAISNPASSD